MAVLLTSTQMLKGTHEYTKVFFAEHPQLHSAHVSRNDAFISLGVDAAHCKRWCEHAEKEINSKIEKIEGLEGKVGVDLKVDGKLLVLDDALDYLRKHHNQDQVDVESDSDSKEEEEDGVPNV